jgi:hypothetical protein
MKYEDDHFASKRMDPDKTIPLTVPEHLAVSRVVATCRTAENVDTSDWVGKMHARFLQLAVRLVVALVQITDGARLAAICRILGHAFLAWADEYGRTDDA